MIPPSRHPVTGGPYLWRVAPWDLAPPAIPSWLAGLLAPPPEPVRSGPWEPTTERARTAIMRAIHAVQDAPSGAANDTLNRVAFKLGSWCGAGLLHETEAEASLHAAARQRKIPDREARDTIRSGIRAGLRHPVQARYA